MIESGECVPTFPGARYGMPKEARIRATTRRWRAAPQCASMSYPIQAGRLLMRIRPAPLAALLKRLLFIRRTVVDTPAGAFWIDPASYLGVTLARDGIYEPPTLAALRGLVHAGDHFIDVGANEGYFTVVASKSVGPTGHVIAVEPQRRVLAALRRNLALNRCENVTVAEVAISDAPGTAMLYLTSDMNSSASGLSVATRYPLPAQEITCMTLERLFARWRVPEGAVVKMDIEGWEYEAILGSPELFRSNRVRALVLELHPNLMLPRGRNPDEIVHFLASCGYRGAQDAEGLAWVKG
jgi:FkbM family methyltransferase